MQKFQTGQRVTATGYGLGTVVKPHAESEYRVIVQWDRTDGFHGARPVIMWSHSLTGV